MNKRLFILFFCFMYCLSLPAQTSGISEVVGIESKINTIEANKQKIAQQKSELPGIESAWQNKLQKLKDELAALQKDRDDLLADMRVGAKCSECGTYKSVFEKKGIDFKAHLGAVKGYAVPATTTELDATRKEFTEKIAYKKVQIQNFEAGDNAVVAAKNKIAALEKDNTMLCGKITQHSKDYETKVLSEAKAKHNLWTDALMNDASAILIADDRTVLFKARITRYENEFQQESAKARERIKKENLEKQALRSTAIEKNNQQLSALQAAGKSYLAPIETDLQAMLQQRDQNAHALAARPISDSVKLALTEKQDQLLAAISLAEKKAKDYRADMAGRIAVIEKDSKFLKDEIVRISGNLAKEQQQETARLQTIYDQKKQEARLSESTAATALAAARKTYTDKAAQYKKQHDDFLALVGQETDRMTIAGQKTNCPVWNNTKAMANTHWNQVFSCVNSITTMAKPYSNNVFNTYCPGKSSSTYMVAYKGFLSGLGAEDKEVIRLNSNAGWFELMTQ